MQDDGDISAIIMAQAPVVQSMIRSEVEHGVLIPLKTTMELQEEYATEKVFITRAPVKSANPAIA